MELVLVKNRGEIKVYQGKLDCDDCDYFFFATSKNGVLTDIVVHTLATDEMTIIPVNDRNTLDVITRVLVNEYVAEGVWKEKNL